MFYHFQFFFSFLVERKLTHTDFCIFLCGVELLIKQNKKKGMKPGTIKNSCKKSNSSTLDMRKSVEVQVDSDFALLLPGGVYEIKKMEPRSRIRSIILVCMILAVAGIIGFGYFCPDQVQSIY